MKLSDGASMTWPRAILVPIICLACGFPAAAIACREVIVGNEASHDLAIVDPAVNRVVGRISVGKQPRALALSSDREWLFVSLRDDRDAGRIVYATHPPARVATTDEIAVFDLDSRHRHRTFAGIGDPGRLAVSADGRRLFVTSGRSVQVLMLDAGSGEILRRTAVGGEPSGLDLSPGGIRVFATSLATGRVSILDARSGTLVSQISVGSRPRSTAFSRDGLHAYVANEAAGTISVLDTSSLRKTRTLTLPTHSAPARISVPREGAPLYVSTGRNGEILAVDPHGGRVLARAISGARPRAMALSEDGKALYVANGPSNDISIFALPRLELRARIHTGGNPSSIVCRDRWWAREDSFASGTPW